MSLTLQLDQPPGAEIQRLLREQADVALDALIGQDREQAVHAARKACKRGRAVLRLARSGMPARRYRALQDGFRDAARWLSPIRDADVLQQTAPLAGAAPPPRVGEEEGLHRVMASRILLREQARSLDEQPVQPAREDLIAGFVRGYAKARRQLGGVSGDSDAEVVHEWRKSVKYHCFHLQVVADLFPGPLGGLAVAADGLQEALGDHHDLSVLRGLVDDPEAARSLLAREAALAEQAIAAGRQQFALEPDAFGAWLRALWAAQASEE